MISLRSRRLWLAAALFALLALAWAELTKPRGDQVASFVPARRVCGADGPLRYCIHTPRAGAHGDILYHLHGRNLDERVWNDDTYLTGMIQSEWQRSRAAEPIVVSLSYGGSWLLAPKGRARASGLLDDLTARLPHIETRIGTPKRRILLGESMGGLNALIMGLSAPRRFAKVAALCPGVYATSPFAPLSEISAAARRTGANPKTLFGVWMMARHYVTDESEWRRIDPLRLIERAGPDAPSLYLSNGLYDAYGNFEGTQRLAERARARGLGVEWHPIYGGHCATDIASLAAFLVD